MVARLDTEWKNYLKSLSRADKQNPGIPECLMCADSNDTGEGIRWDLFWVCDSPEYLWLTNGDEPKSHTKERIISEILIAPLKAVDIGQHQLMRILWKKDSRIQSYFICLMILD